MPVTSRLSVVEIASALARRARERLVSEEDRDRAIAALEADLARILVVELTDEIAMRAQTLVRRYPIRAGDAVQLASCLFIQDELGEKASFVGFDDRLDRCGAKRRPSRRLADEPTASQRNLPFEQLLNHGRRAFAHDAFAAAEPETPGEPQGGVERGVTVAVGDIELCADHREVADDLVVAL